MMLENPPQLPQIDSAKFMAMGPWAKPALDQLKDRVEISAGDGDQTIISVAMESFAKDVAYSGVLAAYERSQKAAWARGDGPLATKFDLLIHHFDATKELLTNTEARREVQAVIVNLCGGKERYKFLYDQGAEDYQVADLVKAVVEQWGTTQSKQAQIDSLGRQPETAVNREEAPVVDAEEVYQGLNEKGRRAIDAFAAKFIESGANPELVQDLIVLLPDLKTAADYFPGGSKALIEKMDLPNDLKKELDVLLNLKPIPKGKVTIEKRVEQAIANNQLYSQIDQVINWRTGVLKERREAEQRMKQQAESLSFRLGEGKEGSVVAVDLDLKQLAAEAVRLGIDLPVKTFVADAAKAGSAQVGEISVTLNKDWQASRSSFEYQPFTQRTVDRLAAAETLHGAELEHGYSLTKDDQGKFRLFKGDQPVAEVNASEGGQIVFNWAKDTTADQGLTALAVLGQWLNDHFAEGEKFPSLYLELKAPEPTRSNLEVEPTASGPEPAAVKPNEELVIPDWLKALREEREQKQPETESASPVEDFWKFEAPPPAEPPAPEPEPAPVDTSSQAPVMPDWLRALQEVPSTPAQPPVEEKAEGPVEEMEAQAPTPTPEPEAPLPVQVNNARKPIETVAKTIRERGGAGFEFDETSTHNLFHETLDSLIKNLHLPGLTINNFGISQFQISGGQIRLTVSAGGSYKKGILPAIGVSALMHFGLTSNLDLLGEPEIDLPRLAPKEAKGVIVAQLKNIKLELRATIMKGLEANNIIRSKVDFPSVRNNSLVTTIKGEVRQGY